jgi:hypothetical protein
MSVEIMPIIAGAMEHSHDGNPIIAYDVENEIVAYGEKAQALGEIVAALARVPMAGEHLTGFVDSVELPIRRERIVVRDVTPDFHEVDFSTRTAMRGRHQI